MFQNSITLTQAARERLLFIQEQNHAKGMRIALKKGGCAGMEYTFNSVEELPKNAQTVVAGKLNLIIDPLAEMFLLGTEIDYEETLLQAGFVFKNPNVKSACGCGASVSF